MVGGTDIREGSMADHLRSSCAIIRFDSRTYESGGVMAVLKAHTAAENLMRDYEFGKLHRRLRCDRCQLCPCKSAPPRGSLRCCPAQPPCLRSGHHPQKRRTALQTVL